MEHLVEHALALSVHDGRVAVQAVQQLLGGIGTTGADL
jgi:hypothetical protein